MLIAFVALLLVALIVDLKIGHNGLSVRKALVWSVIWIGLSFAFGGLVWHLRGAEVGAQWITGYLLEKSLSVDNLFVFLIIFRHFHVPSEAQPRVLAWGIVGAVFLRMAMIYAGSAALHRYQWVMYLFGASLLLTGARTMFESRERKDPANSWLVRQIRKVVPIAPKLDGQRFFTRVDGKLMGTILLLVLIVVELTDVIFAVDSIPAIFAITDDPFIILTSNVLALVGLRALFFALSSLLLRLRYLRYGLGTILILVGLKMFFGHVLPLPSWAWLIITCGILAVTIAASLMRPRPAPATSST